MQRPVMTPLSRRLCRLCLAPTSTRPATIAPFPSRAYSTPDSPVDDALSNREETIQKAQIVFGSRIAGPIERERELNAKATLIAGILVPPRPEEPDNCCMSGCVNCVWERYQEELDDWVAKSGEARKRVEAQRHREREERIATRGVDQGGESLGISMDDDGGGSEGNWDDGGKDLMGDVPVGIREFMKVDKKLKEKKRRALQE